MNKEEEFNLSEKRISENTNCYYEEGETCKSNYKEEDVKEFIRLLKLRIDARNYSEVCDLDDVLEIIDEIAGDKLTGDKLTGDKHG